MSLFEIILAVGLALTLLLTLKSLQVATKALKETGSIKPLALESVQLLMENGEEETLPLGTIALLPLQVEAFLMKAQASAWKNGGDWHSRHWRGREYEIEATFWKNKNWEVQLRMHNDANSKGFTLERNTGWQPSADPSNASILGDGTSSCGGLRGIFLFWKCWAQRRGGESSLFRGAPPPKEGSTMPDCPQEI